MVYVFLADGFEIIEAMAPIDMLGRAKVSVKTVGVTGKSVKSSGGIEVVADITTDLVRFDDMDMIILPGGMPGTINLEADATVQKSIDYCIANNKFIAAICAAPTILAHKNLLDGKKATVFPTFSDELKAAQYTAGAVETAGKIITARGAGVCIPFGLTCVELLTSKEQAQAIQAQIQS